MQGSFWESTRETCVRNSAPILAIQLCCFSNQGGELVKDETLVTCTQSQAGQYITVPITIEDEISFMNKFPLIATISHSGTLNRGHYWAFIKDLHLSYSYSCNDKLLSHVEESYLNNTTSYILLYRSVIFFQDLLKYIFCKRVLSFRTFSLGVRTHI